MPRGKAYGPVPARGKGGVRVADGGKSIGKGRSGVKTAVSDGPIPGGSGSGAARSSRKSRDAT